MGCNFVLDIVREKGTQRVRCFMFGCFICVSKGY